MFQVRWERRALNELTAIWTQADSIKRQAVTAASHTIDQRLQSNPLNESESRSGEKRITFAAPLAVTFQIEADGHTVSVLQVRLFKTRRP